MQRFILTGDIITAGEVLVEADNIDEAIRKAENGHFLIVEAQKKPFGFSHNPFDQAFIQRTRCGWKSTLERVWRKK